MELLPLALFALFAVKKNENTPSEPDLPLRGTSRQPHPIYLWLIPLQIITSSLRAFALFAVKKMKIPLRGRGALGLTGHPCYADI